MLATAEEEKPKIEGPELKDRFKTLFAKQDQKAIDFYEKQYDDMVNSGEWTIRGNKFIYKIQSWKVIDEREALEKEGIDENTDRKKYAENYFQRSMLLMDGMTRELFDTLPFYHIENLVHAWSRRSQRGFCQDE